MGHKIKIENLIFQDKQEVASLNDTRAVVHRGSDSSPHDCHAVWKWTSAFTLK